MKILDKLTNIIMPLDDYEDEDVIGVPEEKVIKSEPKRVVNGPSAFSTASYESSHPFLTLHKAQNTDLSVKIHVPHEFGDVRRIADDLKARRAVIVNFEEVEESSQRRICDFTNGVCYMMDGQARRITETMVMYVPAGVNVTPVTSKSIVK